MTLTRGTQRAIVVTFFAALALIYAVAWLSPAVGLSYDDGRYLVTAKSIAAGHGYTIGSLPDPVPETTCPPLFPAILALFTLISAHAQWLKLLPLLCTAGWLWLTRKLLLKMGASRNGAILIVGLTAASPAIVFLGTNLLAETLFALLITGALLMLLEDRPVAAGVLAGLATLALTAGAALIVACIATLAMRRRLRSATIFAAVAMAMVAPWFGWSLANAHRGGYYGSVVSNVVSSLPANEKLIVLTRNAVLLLESPVSLLTGFNSIYAVFATGLVITACIIVRRQLVPDLFVALYAVMLLCVVGPPDRPVAAILPMLLWIVWRVVKRAKRREALAAMVLIVAGLAAWADTRSLRRASQERDNWTEMRKLFDYVRANTPQSSVVMANLDPVVYLNTGRKTIRGYVPNRFGLYYASRETGVTPDELSNAIIQSRVSYVVLTPDRELKESASFHKSAEALERGGILEPVVVSGVSGEYRLLHVAKTGS